MSMSGVRFGVLDLFAYLDETLELAPAVEEMGYARYWITENQPQPSPILLSALVAGVTERIRVGTAAILFHYYSPAKAAYDFQMLEATYPGRIDAGFCASWVTTELQTDLLDGRPDQRDAASYGRRVQALLHYLRSAPGNNEEYATVWQGAEYQPPELWVHGTGAGSATIAAQHGLALGVTVSNFYTKPADPAHVAAYRSRFQPQGALQQPCVAVAVAGICAETDDQAQALLDDRRPSGYAASIVGAPERWRRDLGRICDQYQPDDIVVLDLCRRYEDRLTSYRLLAEAIGLG